MTRLRSALEGLRRRVRSLTGTRRLRKDDSRVRLERILSHRFKDPALLRQALTHRSATPQGECSWLKSNERLEFLGDAVLNCLITELLYTRHPERSEGQLSKIKSLVVSRQVLAQCAGSMGLGEYLILGPSERKSGGRSRRSLLANVFEAVLGAAYLDGGLRCARRLLEKHLFCRIEEFVGNEEYVNYKSALLELAQRDGFGAPQYRLEKTSGPDHAMQFHMSVAVAGVTLGHGHGNSKKAAEQLAAYEATVKYDTEHIKSHRKGVEADELVSH
jgi:ribonuclease III